MAKSTSWPATAPAIVFVEVKARATAEFGSAAEAVTPLKQATARRRWPSTIWPGTGCIDRPCRFDVVAIDGLGAQAVITVYRSAFESR